MKLLIVGNHEDEVRFLTLLASRAGFAEVATTVEGRAQAWLARQGQVDAMVVATRDERALGQVRAARGWSEAPMLVIVSHLKEDLHAQLLDAGADVALGSPYKPQVLRSQLRALARRNLLERPLGRAGDLVQLDAITRTVQTPDGSRKRLSELEFRLLDVLLDRPGRPVSPAELVSRVWGCGPEHGTDLVRKLVSRLRLKIEPDPSHPIYLVTVPGRGYAVGEAAFRPPGD